MNTITDREPRIWWHWQNLNERRHRSNGSGLRHGRAWLHWGRRTWQVSWHFFRDAGFSVGVHFDDGMNLHLQLPWLLSVFFFIPFGPGVREARECEISFRDWTLRINPLSKAMSWSSSDPWWVRGLSLNVTDVIFGCTEHHSEIVSEHKVLVPMPEGMYPGTVKINHSTWTRSRWPGVWLRRIDSQIDMETGIPCSGKGENSWDCGDDALYGCGSSEPTVEAAIAAAVKASLESRRRYGMPSENALSKAVRR